MALLDIAPHWLLGIELRNGQLCRSWPKPECCSTYSRPSRCNCGKSMEAFSITSLCLWALRLDNHRIYDNVRVVTMATRCHLSYNVASKYALIGLFEGCSEFSHSFFAHKKELSTLEASKFSEPYLDISTISLWVLESWVCWFDNCSALFVSLHHCLKKSDRGITLMSTCSITCHMCLHGYPSVSNDRHVHFKLLFLTSLNLVSNFS